MKKIVFIATITLLFTSCFKKEKGITLPAGVTEINSCYLGDNYEKQMFFDLSTNTFQEKQLIDWDLSFQSSDGGYGIFINTGYNIKVRKADIYNLNEVKASDTNYILGLPELLDGANGKVANSAIGDWRQYQKPDGFGGTIYGIYFIELSYLSGRDRFRRLQIHDVNDTAYTVKITNLDMPNAPPMEIKKDKNQNYTFYSFKHGGGIVNNVEPPKGLWDIEFTRYKTIIPNPPTTILYSVSGVFSNRNNVLVAVDSVTKFEDIDAGTVSLSNFRDDRDVIGYTYKSFDYANGASGRYTVNTAITYLIKDTDGYYYKLRFLDFYDKQGRRGNPKFEFMRIK